MIYVYGVPNKLCGLILDSVINYFGLLVYGNVGHTFAVPWLLTQAVHRLTDAPIWTVSA